MSTRQRVVGIAPVKPVPLDSDELTGRLAAWRYIQGARAAARDGRPYGFSRQAQKDIEVLASVLADLLALHEPEGHAPLCPACSTPGDPHLWPCLTWRRIVGGFV